MFVSLFIESTNLVYKVKDQRQSLLVKHNISNNFNHPDFTWTIFRSPFLLALFLVHNVNIGAFKTKIETCQRIQMKQTHKK